METVEISPNPLQNESMTPSIGRKFSYFLLAIIIVVFSVISGATGYYFGMKNAQSLPKSQLQEPQNKDVLISEETSSIKNTKNYEGRFNPFVLTYPASYSLEISDVKDTDQVMEQVIFKDASSQVDEFTVRIDSNVTELPKYPYDQLPTGEFTHNGMKGVYLELPEGYGDGGNWKPRPTTYIFLMGQGRVYEMTFYGVSDMNNSQLQSILQGFKVTPVAADEGDPGIE